MLQQYTVSAVEDRHRE